MIKTLQELLSEKIAVGIIGKTHGLNGELKLHPFTNVLEIIENLKEVVLYNEKQKKFFVAKITSIRKANKFYLIKLEGINNIENAKALSGSKIYIDEKELPEIKENEYYFYEIIGCKVFDENEKEVGIVEEILQTGSNDVFVVKNEKEEILIPVTEEYVKSIDKKEKLIKIKLPEWLD
ncbi:16S rRNA processing protein RimM [Thermosipho ferrireducens]|uniref:Ribosome maturation factor RimM n=1 Tax=Thermosipho ferrireducens TaxID=2571116 RepID=A0ABX7S7H0_9BACT|nr:ribosome maturation factor RimM [Thermosipho ferrireducens]QTA37745.1 16S rRNA processing protein RimM [Thermosipho ferrireducens]